MSPQEYTESCPRNLYHFKRSKDLLKSRLHPSSEDPISIDFKIHALIKRSWDALRTEVSNGTPLTASSRDDNRKNITGTAPLCADLFIVLNSCPLPPSVVFFITVGDVLNLQIRWWPPFAGPLFCVASLLPAQISFWICSSVCLADNPQKIRPNT